MLNTRDLLSEYKNKRLGIRKRLKEFAEPKSETDTFVELAFCICTPQSNAKRVATVVNSKNLDILTKAPKPKLADALRARCRFHNNKAGYIIEARQHIPKLRELPESSVDARDWLVGNVKGVGFKEASHFLRNIGYRDLSIIDRHVVNLLKELQVLRSRKMPSGRKQYLSMENRIRKFSKDVNIDMDELDLLLWSMKTGFIFK